MEVKKASNAIRTTKSVQTAKTINGDKWKRKNRNRVEKMLNGKQLKKQREGIPWQSSG